MELSNKDFELLKHLCNNGKASQRELAAATGFALGTVSNHLKNLEKKKIINGYSEESSYIYFSNTKFIFRIHLMKWLYHSLNAQ